MHLLRADDPPDDTRSTAGEAALNDPTPMSALEHTCDLESQSKRSCRACQIVAEEKLRERVRQEARASRSCSKTGDFVCNAIIAFLCITFIIGAFSAH